jgi:hypothetical protein
MRGLENMSNAVDTSAPAVPADFVEPETKQRTDPMKNIHLRVKRMALAAEARIIKQQEQRALDEARRRAGIFSSKQRRKLHRALLAQGVKADSAVYADAFYVAQQKAHNGRSNHPNIYHYDLQSSLRIHRIHVVRPAARAAHLAHAYLKGMAYARVENGLLLHEPVTLLLANAVAENVRKFGTAVFAEVKSKQILDWINGGYTAKQIVDFAAEDAT